MGEGHLQRRHDAVEIRRQQLRPEIRRRLLLGPGHAVLLIRAEQHPLPLLAQIQLTAKVGGVNDLAPGAPVVVDDLGHGIGQEIVVLHGEDGQFQPGQAADLARPEPAGIDHMFGPDGSRAGDHIPAAIGAGHRLQHRVAQLHRRAEALRRPGIGMGYPGRIHMRGQRVEQRPDKMRRIQDRQQLRRLAEADDALVDPVLAAARGQHAQPVQPVLAVRQQDGAGPVHAAILARQALDFLDHLDGVFLQPGDIGIAVQHVHAAGGVPGGTAGQLRALDEQRVPAAMPGEVEQHRAADNAAADDNYLRLGLHRSLPHCHGRLRNR